MRCKEEEDLCLSEMVQERLVQERLFGTWRMVHERLHGTRKTAPFETYCFDATHETGNVLEGTDHARFCHSSHTVCMSPISRQHQDRRLDIENGRSLKVGGKHAHTHVCQGKRNFKRLHEVEGGDPPSEGGRHAQSCMSTHTHANAHKSLHECETAEKKWRASQKHAHTHKSKKPFPLLLWGSLPSTDIFEQTTFGE